MRQEIHGPCKISHLNDRVCTIIKQGDSNWRVTYVGFNQWHEGTAFLMPWAKVLEARHGAGKHCQLRKAKRLNGWKYEVKIWGLTKNEVLQINADLGNHHVSFAEYNQQLVDVLLNGQFVGRMTTDCREWLKEQTVRLSGLTHDAAKTLLSSWLLGA